MHRGGRAARGDYSGGYLAMMTAMDTKRKAESRQWWSHVQKRLARFWEPVPHEVAAQRDYLRLIQVSLRFCARYGDSLNLEFMAASPYHYRHFSVGFGQGFANIREPETWSVPPCPRLAARWTAWGEEYEALLKRNPIIELRETLSDVSEEVTAESWPYGYEDDIKQWLDEGAVMPCTCKYFGFAMTQEIADKLIRLRPLVAGWLYWDDTVKAVVFRGEDKKNTGGDVSQEP